MVPDTLGKRFPILALRSPIFPDGNTFWVYVGGWRERLKMKTILAAVAISVFTLPARTQAGDDYSAFGQSVQTVEQRIGAKFLMALPDAKPYPRWLFTE